MAEAKSSESKSAPKAATKSTKEVSTEPHYGDQVIEGEESYEKGYWGTRATPFADEEFALTTGPNSPITDLQGNPTGIDPDDHIESEPAS
jgi:hypothetical protein